MRATELGIRIIDRTDHFKGMAAILTAIFIDWHKGTISKLIDTNRSILSRPVALVNFISHYWRKHYYLIKGALIFKNY